MDQDRNALLRRARRYSRMVVRAVELGVPLDDILAETTRFHGEVFAAQVRGRIASLL